MEDEAARPRLFGRVIRAGAVTVGGGAALLFLFSGSAQAVEVVDQDATVTNVGAATANSGGNVAVGNDSTNVGGVGQAAIGGGGASNVGGASNASDGTATVSTGDAGATGNQSATAVDQTAATTGGPGVSVVSQGADVANVGGAAANTGGNAAVGNDSTNIGGVLQIGVGGGVSNVGTVGNGSNGTATIATGNADASGNRSTTAIGQAAATSAAPGVHVVDQRSDVLNLGLALADTGGNTAVGNDATNIGLLLQLGLGGAVSNVGDLSNDSDGTASVITGDATAGGNTSDTAIVQAAAPGVGPLSVVNQGAALPNLGLALASSGGNGAFGNTSTNLSIQLQLALALLASNVSAGGNTSNGFAPIITGGATSYGNDATNHVHQSA